VQLLATETGWQLAAAARSLPGMGSGSPAILNAAETSSSPAPPNAGSLKSWTESMSDAWERLFEAVPAQQQTTRS
jgi:hypothetical protein